jgi:hypothetical protein
MTVRRNSLFTVAGVFVLAAALGSLHYMHGSHSDTASGFLMGVAIGLLILGLARPSRRVSR